VVDDFVGQGYGIPTQAGEEALELLARTEGVLLDPVYTAKAHGRVDRSNQV
jgi:1-aminocyclopropane-1-carboxylate deaminase/D-cysteine desulfhydrase-like pyridoxal-dependent ACC family enzyme